MDYKRVLTPLLALLVWCFIDTIASAQLLRPQDVSKRYRDASPVELLPMGVEQILITGAEDKAVPPEHGREYEDAARKSGDKVRLTVVDKAGHFEVIAPGSPAWPAVEEAVLSALRIKNWKLVWADEFENDGRPDPRYWSYETGFVRNRELQWYQADNAWCEKGMLIIESRRERKQNPNYEPNSKDWKASREYADYTSASLMTKGRRHWQYGRFEMRGRIDVRPGLWPAFWTLGVEGEWPSNGEIDIMEYYRSMLLANVAWGTQKRWVAEWDSIKKPIAEFNDPDWSRKFHLWRMDWDDKVIRLYVDEILLNTTDLRDTFNKNTEGKNPFHQPHYMILNLAIGGTNGGDPSWTDFPTRFEVDYVRVYQK